MDQADGVGESGAFLPSRDDDQWISLVNETTSFSNGDTVVDAGLNIGSPVWLAFFVVVKWEYGAVEVELTGSLGITRDGNDWYLRLKAGTEFGRAKKITL